MSRIIIRSRRGQISSTTGCREVPGIQKRKKLPERKRCSQKGKKESYLVFLHNFAKISIENKSVMGFPNTEITLSGSFQAEHYVPLHGLSEEQGCQRSKV